MTHSKPLTIYISGPMTGLPEFNYPAFREAEATLKSLGFEVESPHHNGDDDTAKTWDWYMHRALEQLLRCDAVAVLDGWENSKGVFVELFVAKALNKDVRMLPKWIEFGLDQIGDMLDSNAMDLSLNVPVE